LIYSFYILFDKGDSLLLYHCVNSINFLMQCQKNTTLIKRLKECKLLHQQWSTMIGVGVGQIFEAILEGPPWEFHQDTLKLAWQDEENSDLKKMYSI